MAILDKAKTGAERARSQAGRGMAAGRARLDEMRVRRQRGRLFRQLGEACYAEHSGGGTHEAVAAELAALDAHAQAHPEETRQARDIMHAGAECISADETVAVAAKKMRDLGVGSLPICGADDRLHGIITDRDIVVTTIAEGRDPAELRVGDLAQGTPLWVDANADVGEVLRQMESHRIKRLPVIDNHRIVGMISEADLARNLDEHRLAEFVEKVYASS
jgi:CBS domain-containing protein